MSHDEYESQTSLNFPTEQAPVSKNSGVRLEVDESDIAWILFDLPGEKINKLTTSVMESIRDFIDAALRRQAQGLIFASDKPGMFIAGADIEEIKDITDVATGKEKAAYGQAVFEAIARFPKPTIAVVTGPCVGGGYELSLACTYIVAENVPAVRLGLPEVKLGILPGFGGTQRLPQRVGLPQALDMILAGKTLPAKLAFRRGYCDALVPPGQGRRVAKEILKGERSLRRRKLSRLDKLMGQFGPLRNIALGKARDALRKKAPSHQYPSPHMAVNAIAAGFTKGDVQAYDHEARLLGEAIVTPTSKNLIWLYQAQSKSKEPAGLDLAEARNPQRLAVLGAGVMGGSIAWLAGEKGYPIRIKDINVEAIQGALKTAGGLWAQAAKRRRITPGERDRRLEKLSYTLDYSGFESVDLVVEAVVENLDIKHRVIAETEAHVKPDCVIASNTSSLRIGDIAAQAQNPERIVGLHFFNPVHRMPLVEVVAGPQSAGWAVATAYQLALDMGKTPILVHDAPAFLVNRLLTFYLAEALAFFEEGADPVAVDRALQEFGMPMGPYELLDQIGLDVAAKVTGVVGEAFGVRLPESTVVDQLVEQGLLGKKSGKGFYTYEKGKAVQPSTEAQALKGSASPVLRDSAIVDQLILPMVNEAARCLEEGVIQRSLDVDLGMVMGTGFPPFRGGLLRWADTRGVETIVARLQELASKHSRLAPSEALRNRTRFY